MNSGIVIVGSGITAINAIRAIREVDASVEIHLFGEEKFYPYNRIKLSKSLFDELEEERILLQKKNWYEDNKVTVHFGAKIVDINTELQEVTVFDGSKMRYDKVLLVTGASNSMPLIEGINKKGVYTLRTLEDAQNIKRSIESKNTILNIGGGIQGLETAWILHQHGKQVVIAEVQSRLMPKQLDERASKILQEVVESKGIRVLLNSAVDKVLGEKEAQEAITKAGEKIQCDMIIYSAGIKPNIEIIKNTSIKTNRGIIVNERMETNVQNVYAAGDVAEFDGQVVGLWNIAIAQGKTAGYNISSSPVLYEKIVPVTTLNAFDISLFSMGCVEENNTTKVIVEAEHTSKNYKKIFIENNKVIGAIVIGDTKKSPILKAAIEKKTSLENIDVANTSITDLLDKLKNK